MMEIKVDNQVAAPAETRNTQLAPSDKTSLTKSADGRVATVATRRGEKPCPIKKKMNPLDSDRPSHGRLYDRTGRFVAKVPLKRINNDGSEVRPGRVETGRIRV